MLHHHPKSTRIRLRAKKFRNLYQEQRDLWNQKRQAPLVGLKEPFTRGSERFFILTDKAQERDDADDLSFVLTFFQNHQTCRKGQFHFGKPPGRRWLRDQVSEHHLHQPRLYQLHKDSFPRHHFHYLESRYLHRSNQLPPARQLKTFQLNEKVSFKFPKLLKSHTQPRVITHLPLHDPALESRLQELDTILWESDHRGEISKALHRRHWHWNHRSLCELRIRQDFRHQLQEANSDPTIKSAISPRFFYTLDSPISISLAHKTPLFIMII